LRVRIVPILALTAANLIGTPSAAAAPPDASFSLDYVAPAECPQRQALLDQVARRSERARLSAPGEASVAFVVELVSSPSSIHARLEVRRPEGMSIRELESDVCEDVIGALGLVIAVTIDPSASTAPLARALAATPPKATTSPAPRPLPPAAADLPDQAARSKRPSRARQPRAALEAGGGALFVVDVGPAPNPLLGAAGFVQLRSLASPGFSIRFEVGYQEAAFAPNVDETLAVALLRTRIETCFPGLAPTDWLVLWPCADVNFGALMASRRQGIALDILVSETGPWLALGLGGRVEVLAHEYLSIEVRAGLTGNLTRPSFGESEEAERDLDFEPSPLGGAAGLGVGTAF